MPAGSFEVLPIRFVEEVARALVKRDDRAAHGKPFCAADASSMKILRDAPGERARIFVAGKDAKTGISELSLLSGVFTTRQT